MARELNTRSWFATAANNPRIFFPPGGGAPPLDVDIVLSVPIFGAPFADVGLKVYQALLTTSCGVRRRPRHGVGMESNETKRLERELLVVLTRSTNELQGCRRRQCCSLLGHWSPQQSRRGCPAKHETGETQPTGICETARYR